MWTYTLINLAIMVPVIAVMLFRRTTLPRKSLSITVIVLLALTAIFDSLIILADIVGYNEANMLGIYIGAAPIEDFAYALLAAVFVPYLWQKLGEK